MGAVGTGKTLTFFKGKWHDGSPAILAPRNHAFWLASTVFDGARAIDGKAPDLGLHCARVVRSARIIGLDPMITGPEIEELAWDGIRRFPKKSQLYICPMFYGEEGFILPQRDAAQFVLSVYEAEIPAPDGFSACLSSFRRPARDMAPTEAKASCLYPNIGRCQAEANEKGFDVAVVLDPSGNVAEFSFTNLFMVKDGVVSTPVPNGTFLNGITRQRVIQLLRDSGQEVVEQSIMFKDVLNADEVFATGNYAKVQPCTKIEDRALPIGPVYKKVHDLYWQFARNST